MVRLAEVVEALPPAAPADISEFPIIMASCSSATRIASPTVFGCAFPTAPVPEVVDAPQPMTTGA